MKILELCSFSAGICGVWNRVKEESARFSKEGYSVRVFSSNITKGSGEIAASEDFIGKVRITRFPAKKLGGESFMKWDFEKEAVEFSPDIIIAHAYRHTHTTKALNVAERLRTQGKTCRVFLVTHGPFARDNTRSFTAKWAVRFYDWFIGPKTLNKFTKVVAITKWEIPYLTKFGLEEKNIEYIPNGLPKEFFKQKKGREENKILFFGRISPIKYLETLIKTIPNLEDKKTIIDITGFAEKEYLKDLKELVVKLGVEKRVKFSGPIYEIKDKIKKYDSCRVFALPSKSEAMPQSLIEAMAREKVVVASDNPGAKDLVEDGSNGYLFPVGNVEEFVKRLNIALKEGKTLKKKAMRDVERFAWENIMDSWEQLFEQTK